MKDWQPVAELESLLHALEAELLSTTDEEIRDALGRHQPARIAVRTVSTAVAMPDIIDWRRDQPARLRPVDVIGIQPSLTPRIAAS
jgi:hypothetical protein